MRNMKKSTILKSLGILVFIVLGYTTLNAQNPITVDARNLYQHATNSTDVVGPVAIEATDSVTNGGTTFYYVMPDASVNAGFNPVTDLFLNVTSTFAWSVTGGPAGTISAVATHATAPHYRQIAWTGLGFGNVQVIESSGTGCPGSTRTIPVRVINAPNVTGASFSAISCPTGVPPYTVAGPTVTLTLSSDVAAGHRDLEVYYSLDGPGTFVDVPSTLATVDEGNTIDLTGVNLTNPDHIL